MFTIRHSEETDFPAIQKIYARARQFMREHGNPRQWGSVWPPEELLHADIAAEKSYVCESDGEIVATFFYTVGDDPTYQVIDGAWTDDTPYGVVHRIAVSGTVKGAATYCIGWAFAQCGHLRMDTHPDNKVMQRLLSKLGFRYCGIINVEEDNDPRLAYEKIG